MFVQLLYQYINRYFQFMNISEKNNSKIVIIQISILEKIEFELYEENNIILIDYNQKEEEEYFKKIINKNLGNNKAITAHIILLEDLFYGLNQKIYHRLNIYFSNDIKDTIEIIKNIICKKENVDTTDGSEYLTKREKEILILITKGMLNKEIANELNITERTVKNHISNLFKKINVYDRTQAAVYAIKSGIYEIK